MVVPEKSILIPDSSNSFPVVKKAYLIEYRMTDTMYAPSLCKYIFTSLEQIDKFLTEDQEVVFKKNVYDKKAELGFNYIEVPKDKSNWNLLRVEVKEFELYS